MTRKAGRERHRFARQALRPGAHKGFFPTRAMFGPAATFVTPMTTTNFNGTDPVAFLNLNMAPDQVTVIDYDGSVSVHQVPSVADLAALAESVLLTDEKMGWIFGPRPTKSRTA